MKCLKKFLALGMCAGIMSASSCRAVLPDEVMKFYLSTGVDEVILISTEGLSSIYHFLSGGYAPKLTDHAMLENYLSQVYTQKKISNNLDSLRNHLMIHLDSIRTIASALFSKSCLKESRHNDINGLVELAKISMIHALDVKISKLNAEKVADEKPLDFDFEDIEFFHGIYLDLITKPGTP